VKRIQKMLSFSNAVAVLALFLALGGSVYAASSKSRISGTRIKPKSLPGNRIKPKTLTGTQVKPGSLTGKQVVGSSLTGVVASSIGAVQYSVATVTLSDRSTASAGCPSGQKVLGGGATLSDDAFGYVGDSGPTGDRNGWEATGWSYGPSVQMTVTAICTTVTVSTGAAPAPAPTPPRYR
jgi:hypothetical protein